MSGVWWCDVWCGVQYEVRSVWCMMWYVVFSVWCGFYEACRVRCAVCWCVVRWCELYVLYVVLWCCDVVCGMWCGVCVVVRVSCSV